jgi:hypothetical protein
VFWGGRHDQDRTGPGSIVSGIFRYVAPLARKLIPIARGAAPAASRGLVSYAQNMLNAQQRAFLWAKRPRQPSCQHLATLPWHFTNRLEAEGARHLANAQTQVRSAPAQTSHRHLRDAGARHQGGARFVLALRHRQSAGAHKQVVPSAASRLVVPNAVHQRSALAKKVAVSGDIRSAVAALDVRPFDSSTRCYRLATSSKELSDGTGRGY